MEEMRTEDGNICRVRTPPRENLPACQNPGGENDRTNDEKIRTRFKGLRTVAMEVHGGDESRAAKYATGLMAGELLTEDGVFSE